MSLRAKDLEIGNLFRNQYTGAQGLYEHMNDHVLDAREFKHVKTFMLLEKQKRDHYTESYWCKILSTEGDLVWVIFETYHSFKELR